MNHEIIVAASQPLDIRPHSQMPTVIVAAGASAGFAYDEFHYGTISNEHTRIAYRHAIHCFLAWVDGRSVTLPAITPKMVREYLDQMTSGIAYQKKHLAAIRHFFDIAVTRHAVILNPAASVRGQRYQVVEGKTPMIGIDQARRLLESIDVRQVVGLRDGAIIATLIYTAARVSAVAKLRRGDFYDAAINGICVSWKKAGNPVR